MPEGKVQQLEPKLELKDQVIEYLKNQGYKIAERAKLRGKSGVEHTLDILAEKDDGFITYTIAIDITTSDDREAELTAVFNLANKTYDTGIHDRALITLAELSQEAKEFAQKQRIKIFDKNQMAALSTLKPVQMAKPDEPFRFETKSQLLDSLANRGFTGLASQSRL